MREVIYKHALKNALDYGRADSRAVLGKVLAELPELRKKVNEILPAVEEIVREVNSLPREKLGEEIEKYEFIEKKEKRTELPELANAENIVLRFAPNPSGPLHFGHCRAAILNDEYAKKYNGKFILRLEDTDPARVDRKAYDMILHDLEWLDVDIDEVLIQSDRLDIYYEYARKLIEIGTAYVCTCAQEQFQKLRNSGISCECRKNSIAANLDRFEKMFAEYSEGGAVVRLKTDLGLPDPAMRDFVVLRITDEPHPRVKGRRVYPLYNFSVAVDDHLMNVTHVLRGKDHIINTRKQEFIYDYFGWKKPGFIHYGLLKIEGLELSTSLTAKGIKEGEFSGWDDVRLGTLLAMKRRGIQPEAIRKAMLDVGIKDTDISFSWKNLYAYNRGLVEPRANRYFFVSSPRELLIENCIDKVVYAPLHPDFPDKGKRKLEIKAEKGKAWVYISRDDFETLKEGKIFRLMEAFNIEILKKEGNKATSKFHSEELEKARKIKARLIHWVPKENIKVRVIAPEGMIEGFGEVNLKNSRAGDIVQFERFGFVRVDEAGKNGRVVYFAHK